MTVGKYGTSCSSRATAEVAEMQLYVVVVEPNGNGALVATNAHLLPPTYHIWFLLFSAAHFLVTLHLLLFDVATAFNKHACYQTGAADKYATSNLQCNTSSML